MKYMTDDVVIYEQPLNELIRVSLRLEQLFLQIDHLLEDSSMYGTRFTIATIINLLNTLDRPDLKAKLAKELSQHISLLSRLENTPEIDKNKLRVILIQLNDLVRWLIDNNRKIGQNLRELELLNNLRLQLATPGGGCSFDIPVYHYWLQIHPKERTAMIRTWMQEFDQIRLATELMLQLVREASKPLVKTAVNGFYQEQLDSNMNLRLIRVAVPTDIPAYPEVGVSRHIVNIRFLSPSLHERPVQYRENLPFWVSYCSS
jgi:cell division protein ZapD